MTTFEKLAAIAAKCSQPRPDTLVARKSESEATLYVYDAITPEGLGGVSAKQIVAALAEARGVKTLHLRINSVGGHVYEAKAIYNALREFPGRKVAHVDGLAASAATFIAMAADHIVTEPEATWMIHNAQGMTMGDGNAHRSTADLLDMESANIRAIYAKRTGQDEADLKAWMDAETFMTPAEAKARGFTDSIDGESEQPKRVTASAPGTAKVVAAAADTQRRIATLRISVLRSNASVGKRPGQPGK
jgi:ATP-dependent Clp protease, protease subunit